MLRAPARINVLGEHVDYVSYLPTASLIFGSREHEMLIIFRASTDGQVRGASTNEAFAPFTFALGEAPASQCIGNVEEEWTRWLFAQAAPAPHWGNYVKGAIFLARLLHGDRVRRGFEFVIDSTIPPKGGASSSSALTVLAGATIRLANQIEFTPAMLARESAWAEWYVGTRGGQMDHTAICLSQPEHALHLRYSDNQAELVPLPLRDFRWITFFAHEADKGKEVMLAYNERAAVARLLIPAVIEGWRDNDPKKFSSWVDVREDWRAGSWNALGGLQTVLADLPTAITLAEVAARHPQAYAECRQAFPALAQEQMDKPLKLRDRALHHVSEIRRVAAAVKLLRQNEVDGGSVDELARRLGAWLDATHASLRDLYEVSTPEVERLVTIVRADAQVYGARLMGGGFGGNVLALTTAGNVPQLIERVQTEFYAPQGRHSVSEGAVMISTPGNGLY